MDTVCATNKCNGCMACKAICPKNAIEIKDEIQAFNSYMNEEKCIQCGKCKKICPQNQLPELKPPIEWWQGWANNQDIRARASSGGVASELIRSFIEAGGYVCSCVFLQGEFVFEITNDIENVRRFAGSKYVKSNPDGIYKKIENLLKKGEKVLFIGLPCQSAGVKNTIPERFQSNLYRVDLICHGTPSYSLLYKHIQETGYELSQVETISFREKGKWKFTVPYNKDKAALEDIYLMGFLLGRFYTENCYECSYARVNRVSDITLGDSWGSELRDELKKGLSLIMCQTEKGIELIHKGNLHLEPVDTEKAIVANQQLQHPFRRTRKTSQFYHKYLKTKKFGWSFFLTEPKLVFKQQVKYILHKLHLYKPPQNRGGV